MESLRMAFKEWAVICRALGEGKQAIILRKGGIAEEHGRFTPDHSRFWLYPTYVHQQREGIKASALPLLEIVQKEPHDSKRVRFTHFAEVSGVFQVLDLPRILDLDSLHLWSEETVKMKFHYRTPGIFILPVRVYRVARPIEHLVKPEYDGCKTWVDLGEDLSTQGATPVLSDREYHDVLDSLDRILNPTSFA